MPARSAFRVRSVPWIFVFTLLALMACGDDDSDVSVTGPGIEPGSGRLYPVRDVSFATRDGIQVSALFATPPSTGKTAVAILLHDLDGDKNSWLTRSPLVVDLLDHDCAVLAIDLRGYGETPLPDGRNVARLSDLENSYLDVEGALNWLVRRSDVDTSRVALVGSGSGANIAYVSMGVLHSRVRTAVAISAGLWERDTLRPAVVGAGLESFQPESMLFVVAEKDAMPAGDGAGTQLSYVDFAQTLAISTAEPKSVVVIAGSAAHGLALLQTQPRAEEAVMQWLEQHL